MRSGKKRRGRRLQLSAKLGFQGNQVYRWEKGSQSPDWPQFVELCRLRKAPLADALRTFFQHRGDPADIKTLLPLVVGKAAGQSEIARIAETSRLTVSRWQHGDSFPSLRQFLMLIAEFPKVLIEILFFLLQGKTLPCVKPLQEARALVQHLMQQVPYTGAVLFALKLAVYRSLEKHQQGWLAKKAGIIHLEDGKYVRTSIELNSRRDPETTRNLAQYWFQRGLNRLPEMRPPYIDEYFSHAVYSVTHAARAKIDEEFFRFFQRIREITLEDDDPPDELYVVTMMIHRPDGNSGRA